MTEQQKAKEEVEAFKWMTSKGYDRKASKDIAQILVKYKEELLRLYGVRHSFCPECGSAYEKGDCWKFRCSNKDCGHTPKHLG